MSNAINALRAMQADFRNGANPKATVKILDGAYTAKVNGLVYDMTDEALRTAIGDAEAVKVSQKAMERGVSRVSNTVEMGVEKLVSHFQASCELTKEEFAEAIAEGEDESPAPQEVKTEKRTRKPRSASASAPAEAGYVAAEGSN